MVSQDEKSKFNLQAAEVQFVSSVTMVSLTFPVASRTTHEPEARVTMRTNHQANIYLHFKIIYTYKEIYGTDGMFAYNSNRILYITVKEALPGTESGKYHGPQY